MWRYRYGSVNRTVQYKFWFSACGEFTAASTNSKLERENKNGARLEAMHMKVFDDVILVTIIFSQMCILHWVHCHGNTVSYWCSERLILIYLMPCTHLWNNHKAYYCEIEQLSLPISTDITRFLFSGWLQTSSIEINIWMEEYMG